MAISSFFTGSVQYLGIPGDAAYVAARLTGAQGGRGGETSDGTVSWGGFGAEVEVLCNISSFASGAAQLAVVVGGSPSTPDTVAKRGWPDGGYSVPSKMVGGVFAPGSGGGGGSTSLWTADANGNLLDLLAIAGGGGGGHPAGDPIRVVGAGGGGGRYPGGGGGLYANLDGTWTKLSGQNGSNTAGVLGNKLWSGGNGAAPSAAQVETAGLTGSVLGNGGDAGLDTATAGGGACYSSPTNTCSTTIGGRPGTTSAAGLGGDTEYTTSTYHSVGAGGGGSSWINTAHAAYVRTVAVRDAVNGQRSDPATSTNGRAYTTFYDTAGVHDLHRVYGNLYSATDATDFPWVYVDVLEGTNTQTAYQVQIERLSDGLSILDTGKVASTSSSQTVAGGTFTNGITYRWRVRVWNGDDVASPYTTWGAFIPGAKPTVTIDFPTASALVTSQDLTATWTYAHTGGEPQAAYQLVLERLESTVVVESWDTGKIIGSAGSYDFTDVAEGESYRLKVTVWNVSGQESITATVDFNTNYNAPMTPTVSIDYLNDRREQNTMYITNPTPTAGEPEVVANRVYRRAAGETAWTRLSDDALGVFIDIGIASGVAYTYRVVAMAADGRGANSAPSTRTVWFLGVWLHYLATKSGKRNFFYGTGRTEEFDPNITTVKPVGRNFPASEAGVLRSEAVTANVQVMGTEFEHLQRFANAKELVMYRDNRGNRVLGMLTIAGWNEQPWGYEATLRAEVVSGATEEV